MRIRNLKKRILTFFNIVVSYGLFYIFINKEIFYFLQIFRRNEFMNISNFAPLFLPGLHPIFCILWAINENNRLEKFSKIHLEHY